MGCTSSVPNMTTPRAISEADWKQGNNLAETEDSSKDTEKDEKIKSKTNSANVLPNTCDNLVEVTELDRNNKPLFDILKLDHEKGLQSSAQEINNEKIVDDKEDVISNSTRDKLSTLEDVVERVVELYVADRDIESSNFVSSLMDNTNTEDGGGADKINNSTDQQTDEAEPIETKEKSPVGLVSPSQSQGSHATRWEALADVAAELPPSLAIDPLTGQIYALSK